MTQRAFRNSRLPNNDSVPYLGRDLKIKLRDGKPSNGVNIRRNTLMVDLSSRENSNLSSVLEQWYRSQAERLIRKKIDRLSTDLGLICNGITVRGQRTRWASCSQKKNLSFNWRLMMVPEAVLDYVVIHELCHLKEMNHSKKFWEIVAKHCPHWCEHRKWLKDNEDRLVVISPARSRHG